jgi:BirA family transcriptional regulator, biotin operon repressor / biotin---[acetyl-CoA-carboxylase] ligase
MIDLDLIRSRTSVRQIEHHAELPSTNDFVLQRLRELPTGPLPMLVLADRQTQGRGRGDHRWWTSDGALTFSLGLALDARQLPQARRSLLALAAGVAVRDAIGRWIGSSAVQLKWPNDVYVDDRKVSGILIELPAHPPDVCVVGIGVNVSNSLQDAPAELRRSAISMSEACSLPCQRGDVLLQILQEFDQSLQMLEQRPETILQRWQAFCMLTGRWICLRTESQTTCGYCQGIDQEGRLLIDTQQNTQAFASGTVEWT